MPKRCLFVFTLYFRKKRNSRPTYDRDGCSWAGQNADPVENPLLPLVLKRPEDHSLYMAPRLPLTSCMTNTTIARTSNRWIKLPTAAPANPNPSAQSTSRTKIIVQSMNFSPNVRYMSTVSQPRYFRPPINAIVYCNRHTKRVKHCGTILS